MKVVIESNIPFIKGVLEPYADVQYLAPDNFNADAVKDADALLIRTRTRCNKNLFEGSNVKFIGTATIGTDHIDLDYCANKGIKVVSAPGCNAPAVAQYVFAVIGEWMQHREIVYPEGVTLGVVGVGHVGSIVARWGEHMGFKMLLNDPPRAEQEQGFCDLKTIALEADIITFHTPLIKDGKYPTYHLCSQEFLKEARAGLIINAARGAVMDTEAIKMMPNDVDFAIDCWENEPEIDQTLLQRTMIATPHIAGYSAEGKQRATTMILNELIQHFSLPIPITNVDMGNLTTPSLAEVMMSYSPMAETSALKAASYNFEAMRNLYQLRKEVK